MPGIASISGPWKPSVKKIAGPLGALPGIFEYLRLIVGSSMNIKGLLIPGAHCEVDVIERCLATLDPQHTCHPKKTLGRCVERGQGSTGVKDSY